MSLGTTLEEMCNKEPYLLGSEWDPEEEFKELEFSSSVLNEVKLVDVLSF